MCSVLDISVAIMNEVELNEELPESFLKNGGMEIEEKELRGVQKPILHRQNNDNRMEMERVVGYLKEKYFLKIKGLISRFLL